MDYKKDIEVADKLISKLIYYVEIEEGSIEALRNCMASHKAIAEAKAEILEIPCIQCDGSGSYADDEGEEAQCEFCDRIRFPIRDLVAKLKLERERLQIINDSNIKVIGEYRQKQIELEAELSQCKQTIAEYVEFHSKIKPFINDVNSLWDKTEGFQ